MNISNIPRYGASFPLQPQFITNADGCGDHVFTQIKRSGNVCIYRRNKVENGFVAGFEVVVAKTVLAGAKLPGNNVVATTYESYPGGKAFGKNGWFFLTEGSAEDKFNKVVKIHQETEDEKNSVVTTENTVVETQDIPAGEFTLVEFATANCMPPKGAVYNILRSLVEKGSVKESRRVQKGPGRPTVLYIKA